MADQKYFLDANIIISGLLWKGNERDLLILGESGKVTLVTSGYVLMEIERVLSQMGFDETKIIESLVYLRSFITLVNVSEKDVKKYWNSLKDKSDVPVLATAIKSKSILVTGDKELLNVGPKFVLVKRTVEVLKEIDK